jgi:hypothetical protein
VLSLTRNNDANPPRSHREPFVRLIRKWGLSSLLAALLENGSVFAILAAQSIYIASPVLSSWFSSAALAQAAKAIEDPAERAELISELRASKL